MTQVEHTMPSVLFIECDKNGIYEVHRGDPRPDGFYKVGSTVEKYTRTPSPASPSPAGEGPWSHVPAQYTVPWSYEYDERRSEFIVTANGNVVASAEDSEVAHAICLARNAFAAQAPKPASGGSEPLSGHSPLRDALQTMVASAQVYAEGNEITGYRIKTGALHRVIGMLGLTVPSNLPLAALHANYGGFTQKSLDDARDFPLIAAEADTAKESRPAVVTDVWIPEDDFSADWYERHGCEVRAYTVQQDTSAPMVHFRRADPPAADRLAQTVTDAEVEALRESLWSTWGKDRQTTDWPSRAQLAAGLKAALRARESAPAQEPVAWRQRHGYQTDSMAEPFVEWVYFDEKPEPHPNPDYESAMQTQPLYAAAPRAG